MRKLKLTALASIIGTVCAFSYTDAHGSSDYIRNLKVSKASNFDGRIYANGNMQAELLVTYDLIDDEDSIKEVTFKRLYSGDDISDIGWITDVSPNGFFHSINSIELNQEKFKEIEGRTLNKRASTYRYLRTTNFANVDVCVEIETTKGHTADTCDGNTNDSYVSLSSIAPRIFPDSSYDVKLMTENEYYACGQFTRVIQINSIAEGFPGVHTQDSNRNMTVRPNGSNAIINERRIVNEERHDRSAILIPYDHDLKSTQHIFINAAGDVKPSVKTIEFAEHSGHNLVVNLFKLYHDNYGTPYCSRSGDSLVIIDEFMSWIPGDNSYNTRAYYFVDDNDAKVELKSNEELYPKWTEQRAYDGWYRYVDYYGTSQSLHFVMDDEASIFFNGIKL